MRTIVGQIIKCNKIFHIIQNHDKIAIAVSGGKDSLVMWKALDLYIRKLQNVLHWDVQLKAFHVQLNFKKIDYSKIKKFASDNNLDLEIIDSNIGQIESNRRGIEKTFCSLCSKMKKAILINEIKKQKFNKIAFGHHADDAIETLFMNILNQGRIMTFAPDTFLDRSNIHLIRPLILCREDEIIRMAKKMNLPIIKGACAYENITQRAYIKSFLEKNFYQNKHWPNAYINIYTSLLNEENADLWFFRKAKNKKNNLDLKSITTKDIA